MIKIPKILGIRQALNQSSSSMGQQILMFLSSNVSIFFRGLMMFEMNFLKEISNSMLQHLPHEINFWLMSMTKINLALNHDVML